MADGIAHIALRRVGAILCCGGHAVVRHDQRSTQDLRWRAVDRRASVDETNNVAYPAAQNPRFAYPQDAGTANARTLTLSPAIIAYLNNDIFTFLSTVTNTSATVTMNVNGVGAKAIRKSDGSGSDIALGAGDIRDGNFYTLQYSSSLDGMMLLNPSDIAANSAFAVWPSGTLRTLSSAPSTPTASLTHRGVQIPLERTTRPLHCRQWRRREFRAELTPGIWACTQKIVIQEGAEWFGHGSPDYNWHAETMIVFTGTGAQASTLDAGDWTSPFTVTNPASTGTKPAYLVDSGIEVTLIPC